MKKILVTGAGSLLGQGIIKTTLSLKKKLKLLEPTTSKMQ